MRIALVGPYPPPFGGISMHLKRLETHLGQGGHEVRVFPNGSARKWLWQARGGWRDFDVVHFHDISRRARLLIGLCASCGVPAVLTIHGDSLAEQLSAGKGSRRLLAAALKAIPQLVCVKPEIKEALTALGVDPSRVSVINAYLPPADAGAALPAELDAFAAAHQPLIVANGFGAVPFEGGRDLYGIDLTIELCRRLHPRHPGLGCLFFLAQEGDPERFRALGERVRGAGLAKRFRFVLGESLAPALTRAALFVRPTYQDGFGISVTEALHLGVPALASDVCPREAGALTFASADPDDFERRAREMLEDQDSARRRLAGLTPRSAYEPLLEVYRRVAGQGEFRA